MSNGKITGFHVGWRPDRPFPIDMYETLIPPAFGSLEGTDRGKAPTNPTPLAARPSWGVGAHPPVSSRGRHSNVYGIYADARNSDDSYYTYEGHPLR